MGGRALCAGSSPSCLRQIPRFVSSGPDTGLEGAADWLPHRCLGGKSEGEKNDRDEKFQKCSTWKKTWETDKRNWPRKSLLWTDVAHGPSTVECRSQTNAKAADELSRWPF